MQIDESAKQKLKRALNYADKMYRWRHQRTPVERQTGRVRISKE